MKEQYNNDDKLYNEVNWYPYQIWYSMYIWIICSTCTLYNKRQQQNTFLFFYVGLLVYHIGSCLMCLLHWFVPCYHCNVHVSCCLLCSSHWFILCVALFYLAWCAYSICVVLIRQRFTIITGFNEIKMI